MTSEYQTQSAPSRPSHIHRKEIYMLGWGLMMFKIWLTPIVLFIVCGLEHWLSMVCRWQQRVRIAAMTLETKVKVKQYHTKQYLM